MLNSLYLTNRSRSPAVPMLFAALEPELKDRLRRSSPIKNYGPDQFIQHRGSKADGFWLIEEGSVRVGQFLPDGEFRAVAVLGPGDSYGELAVFTGSPRIVDAVSRGDSKVRFIAAAPFLSALAEFPASNHALLCALSAQLQDSLEQLAGIRRGSNPARLASLLGNLADENGITTITQQELADLLGVTRVTTNSALNTLEQDGMIQRGYGKITIHNREALAVYALSK